MDFDGDSFSIIEDRNETFFLVYLYFEQVHFPVSLVIISRIHQHFIEYFVECRHKCNLSIGELCRILGQNPFVGFLHFNAAYVGVGAEEYMLQRCFFLVCLFD